MYRTVVGTIYKIKKEETRPCSQPLNQPQMEVNAVLKTVVGSLEALRATPPSDHAHAHVHVHVHTYVCMCALVADTSNLGSQVAYILITLSSSRLPSRVPATPFLVGRPDCRERAGG